MKHWIFYALLTIFFYGSQVIIRKYLFLDTSSSRDVTILFTSFLGLFLIIASYLLYVKNNKKCDLKSNKKYLYLSILAAFFAAMGILTNNLSIFYVDNISKSASLVHPGQIIFVFLASILYFNKDFNMRHLFGILFSCMGIYLILDE